MDENKNNYMDQNKNKYYEQNKNIYVNENNNIYVDNDVDIDCGCYDDIVENMEYSIDKPRYSKKTYNDKVEHEKMMKYRQ